MKSASPGRAVQARPGQRASFWFELFFRRRYLVRDGARADPLRGAVGCRPRRVRALGGRLRGRVRRLVLRAHGSVSVPGGGLFVRRRVHDRGASDSRLADARRPEPAAPRGPRPGRRPQPTGDRVPLRVRAERVVLRVGRRRQARSRRQDTLIPARFGESAPFTLGVEEELMILDGETFDQVAAVDRIIDGVAGRELPGPIKTELFASVFETDTDVCATVAEGDAALPALRRAASEAAARDGLGIAAAATHPFARPEGQPIVKEERYLGFVAYCGNSGRHHGVQG